MKSSLIFICSVFLLSGCSIMTVQNGEKKVTITTGTGGRSFIEVTDGEKIITVNGGKNTADVQLSEGAKNGSVTVTESTSVKAPDTDSSASVSGSGANVVVKDGSGKTVEISY